MLDSNGDVQGKPKYTWTSIGRSYKFNGIFDGAGYSISGLYTYDTQNYCGLFARLNGTIKNLSIVDSYFESNRCYYVSTFAGITYGDIENCYSSATVLEKPFGSNSYVKGAPAMQSYYVEDGDYVKLDNINVGYTFNLKKQKVIQRLRLYVAGNNLLTMTGYKGLDPEVSIKGLAPGVEGSGAGELYPTTRQFTVGLNLLF